MPFSRRALIRASAAVAAAFAFVLPASAGASPASSSVVGWSAPTPLPGKVLSAAPGTQLKLELAAGAPGGDAVRVEIRPSGALPAGSSLQPADGNPARAAFSWKPSAAQAGDHRVTFTATVAGLPAGSAPPRTFVVRVKQLWPKRNVLSDYSAEVYRWAFVVRRTAVRSGPSRGARVLSRLSTLTPEYFPNLVQTLDSVQLRNGQTWVRVRLAILPNSATGWVRRGALGRYRMVRTRLVVDRGRLRATLFRAGKPVFRSIIGVGQSQWPTPRGHFYVREVLSGYNMPAYGPIAMGISARSPVLTDWPGGGFIGIHGTNAPGILPGRVSHGCIRMPNGNILRLRRLMSLGTPVQVR